MVFLDGELFMTRHGHWRSPAVLDNLIARSELPVMAAVFVDPGVSIAKHKGKPFLSNRQEEYDTLSGAYASFLLDEIFPEVPKHVHIADGAAGRGIAGCSSGGDCLIHGGMAEARRIPQSHLVQWKLRQSSRRPGLSGSRSSK
jgi:enterochelin esterase family protein